MIDVETPTGLAALLRTGSQSEHTEAESAPYMAELLDAKINECGYLNYLVRMRRVYRALEGLASRLAGDPIASTVIDPALDRLAALEADVAFWAERVGGSIPAIHSPATDTYVARIEAAESWGGLFLAHHYTRYLGDLSGGQAIGRILSRAYGLDGAGVAFYDFPQIAKPKIFKDGYRARLDALELDEVQRQRVLDEVKAVFALNGAVFAELSVDLDSYRRVA